MDIELPIIKNKEAIRTINLSNIQFGGDKSFSFMRENDNISKPLVAFELPFFINDNISDVLKNQYGEDYDLISAIKKFEVLPNDILSIRFNISEDNLESDLQLVKEKMEEIFSATNKPIILRGSNCKDIDIKLLPLLAQNAKRQSIISFIDETTYEEVLPKIVDTNHYVIIRTPIDINLAKEMNILASERGLDLDRIIIDPDMGGLGYGLDYGYSVIEKIRQVAFDGDEMLNMPIIGFIGEETFKAKETKSSNYDGSWGEFDKRAIMWEIAGASSIISAGANIVVLWSANAVKALKEII